MRTGPWLIAVGIISTLGLEGAREGATEQNLERSGGQRDQEAEALGEGRANFGGLARPLSC